MTNSKTINQSGGGMGGDTPRPRNQRQREAFVRFYATMTGRSVDDVTNEYMGLGDGIISNKLYQTTELAIAYMNEEATQ